ncbi:MAG: hypothetical protein PHD07_08335 [Bacteroidales bacterium]|nr:hypothetical protein [Bacteroidales bacterium]
MNRISNYLTAALCLLLLTVGSKAQTASSGGKIDLAEDQILNGLPKGIVNPSSVPIKYLNGNKLLYRSEREYATYDLKTGAKEAYDYKPPVMTSNFDESVPGWVNPTFSPDSTRIAYTKDNDLYS